MSDQYINATQNMSDPNINATQNNQVSITNNNLNISSQNFNYSNTSVPVYVLGNYGIAPWGKSGTAPPPGFIPLRSTSQSYIYDFPDSFANWVWYSQLANQNAITNIDKDIIIQYVYNNNSGNQISATMFIIIDNYCDIFLNNNKIGIDIGGGWNGPCNKIDITLINGNNLLEFKVQNAGGPAGLLVSCLKNHDILFHTDNSWKFIPIPINIVSQCTLSSKDLIKYDKYFPWGCLTLNLNLNADNKEYLDFGNIITSMNGISIGCWFKSNNNSDLAKIFDLGNEDNMDNITLEIIEGHLKASIFVTNIQSAIEIDTPINDNTWHHVIWLIQRNEMNINWMFYLDNKLVWTNLNNQYLNYPINIVRKNCYIGYSNLSSSKNFSGCISNFVMFQKVLSISEINALYNSMINSNDPSLYIYLPLASNTVLERSVMNYDYYSKLKFNLSLTKSEIANENWNCLKDNNNWISVKMQNGKPVCMSVDGINCIQTEHEYCLSRNLNPVTPENPVVCNNNDNKWCKRANLLLHTNKNTSSENKHLSSSESYTLKDLVGGSKVFPINNISEVNNILVGGVFKLRVNLPTMPPYNNINKNFNPKKGVNPNYFYLSVESLDNNCSIKVNNQCYNVFADNKNCTSKLLTNEVGKNNSYRLVLISSSLVLDSKIILGKNSDFSFVKFNNQLYLKNIQTGFFVSLYSNDSKVVVYGDMMNNSNTNLNNVDSEIKNLLCAENTKSNNIKDEKDYKFVKCNLDKDSSQYLITSKNIGESSPFKINVNSDKTISLNILSFNKYGFPTNVYPLISHNYDPKNSFAYIEKVTNSSGSFYVNIVGFADSQSYSSNKLSFTVELISFPVNYIKDNSLFVIN